MLRRRSFLTLAALAAALVLAVSGCGGGISEVKVSGSVMRGGKAQDGVRVGFVPADPTQGTASKGAVTNADGKFELKVPPGKYVVVLARYVDKKGKVPGDSENPAEDFAQLEASGALRQVFPQEYTEATSSPFGVEVPASGKEFPPFVVGK